MEQILIDLTDDSLPMSEILALLERATHDIEGDEISATEKDLFMQCVRVLAEEESPRICVLAIQALADQRWPIAAPFIVNYLAGAGLDTHEWMQAIRTLRAFPYSLSAARYLLGCARSSDMHVRAGALSCLLHVKMNMAEVMRELVQAYGDSKCPSEVRYEIHDTITRGAREFRLRWLVPLISDEALQGAALALLKGVGRSSQRPAPARQALVDILAELGDDDVALTDTEQRIYQIALDGVGG